VTSTEAAPDLGGAGSVLVIWSLIVVIIGVALFGYSIVVTVRGGRSGKRRRRAPTSPPLPRRPLPPPPASRPLPLPSGPMVGGVPVGRGPGGPPRALPAGPGARPLALPAGGSRYGAPPPALPAASGYSTAAAQPALPSGPVVGTGYGPAPQSASYGAQPPQQAGSPAEPTGRLIVPPAQVNAPSHGAEPTAYVAGGGRSDIVEVPTISAPSPTGSSTTGIYGAPPASAPPAVGTFALQPRSAPPARSDIGGERGRGDGGHEDDQPGRRSGRRNRPDECAALRAQCEQLREVAAAAAEAAAQAALDAETARADFVAAQRAADEARHAVEAVVQEAADVAAQVATLEQAGTATNEALQAETTHAAFAAYRRGDITSEQLREVFSRAGGWTPEHDRLSRRSTELRQAETEALRTRDAAVAAEHAAGERAHQAAITARARDDEARIAAADARGRCAAADACEQRQKR
jgi:hypothetical protein